MATPGQTTAGAIITTAQELSDNVNSSFISAAEWLDWFNQSYYELYGLLVEAYAERYFTATTFSITTDGVNQQFALPTDFFKLLGVDLLVMGTTYKVTLKPFPFAERNRLSMLNSQIPASGQTVNLLYIPRLTAATSTATVVDGINGWESYISNDLARKAAEKEESNSQPFVLAKAALVQRLQSETANRDAGFPARIADTTMQDVRAMRYALYGSNIWLIGSVSPGWWPVGDWGAEDPGWW